MTEGNFVDYIKVYATSGKGGQGSVHLRTIIRDADTDEILHEITEDQKEVILLAGGKGGLGNWNFRSSTNQTPRYAQPGIDGLDGWFRTQ